MPQRVAAAEGIFPAYPHAVAPGPTYLERTGCHCWCLYLVIFGKPFQLFSRRQWSKAARSTNQEQIPELARQRGPVYICIPGSERLQTRRAKCSWCSCAVSVLEHMRGHLDQGLCAHASQFEAQQGHLCHFSVRKCLDRRDERPASGEPTPCFSMRRGDHLSSFYRRPHSLETSCPTDSPSLPAMAGLQHAVTTYGVAVDC